MNRVIIIESHLASLITPEIVERVKHEIGEDVEIKVRESLIARHHRGEDIPLPAIKERVREPLERPYTIDRREQRRQSKMFNRMTK